MLSLDPGVTALTSAYPTELLLALRLAHSLIDPSIPLFTSNTTPAGNEREKPRPLSFWGTLGRCSLLVSTSSPRGLFPNPRKRWAKPAPGHHTAFLCLAIVIYQQLNRTAERRDKSVPSGQEANLGRTRRAGTGWQDLNPHQGFSQKRYQEAQHQGFWRIRTSSKCKLEVRPALEGGR